MPWLHLKVHFSSIFYILYMSGPVAQLVRAPPCHGGGRRFDPDPGRFKKSAEAGFFRV